MSPVRAPKIDRVANHTAWRAEQWGKLGFKGEMRAFLAQSKMDVARTRGMIEKGASKYTAIRIEAGRDNVGDDPSFEWAKFDSLLAAASV